MQFGFKQNHSTVLCSLIYREVVSNYLQNGSNVNSCLLDASNAFDRIHFGKLVYILIKRNAHFCFIRLILDAYTGQQSRVSWNTCVSEYFPVCNEMKQGGVLVPTLFSKLLIKLMSGYGCDLIGIYMGTLAYADNITI